MPRLGNYKISQNCISIKIMLSDFTEREDRNIERQDSVIKIFVGPTYTSHPGGERAQLKQSHFASLKSILIIKCFANEWTELNRGINLFFESLPMAQQTIEEEDSGHSGSSVSNSPRN